MNYSNGVVEILGLYCKSKNIYLAIVYTQTDEQACGNRSRDRRFQLALKWLDESFSKIPIPAPYILFGGDFNIRNMQWSAAFTTHETTS